MALSTRDKLRLALGDTDSANYVFNDEELDSLLEDESNDVPSATLAGCEAAEARFSRAYDFETDGQKFYRSQQAEAFARLAKRLRDQGVTTSASSSAITSIPVTKLDGWSDDRDSEDVTAGSDNPRQRYVVIGGYDKQP